MFKKSIFHCDNSLVVLVRWLKPTGGFWARATYFVGAWSSSSSRELFCCFSPLCCGVHAPHKLPSHIAFLRNSTQASTWLCLAVCFLLFLPHVHRHTTNIFASEQTWKMLEDEVWVQGIKNGSPYVPCMGLWTAYWECTRGITLHPPLDCTQHNFVFGGNYHFLLLNQSQNTE